MRDLTGTLFAAILFGVAACSPADRDETPHEEAEEQAEAAEPIQPDNTRMNVRDTSQVALTPMDQGESEADRAITQALRQAIDSNPSLSMNAKNVKIVTINGAVTLRGPVESEAEKTMIADLAKGVGGVMSIDNQLEIAPPTTGS